MQQSYPTCEKWKLPKNCWEWKNGIGHEHKSYFSSKIIIPNVFSDTHSIARVMNASITYYADSLIVTLTKVTVHTYIIPLLISSSQQNSLQVLSLHFDILKTKCVKHIQINGSSMQYWKEELMEWKRRW